MIRFLAISIAYWIFFIILFVTVRFLGVEFFFDKALDYPIHLVYLNSIPGGVLMGILWVVVDRLSSRYFLARARTFGASVLIITFTYIFTILMVMFLVSWLMSGSVIYATGYSFSKVSIGQISAALLAAFILIFFQKLDQRVGPGILYKYLTGKYFRPREEERIFLFMDLNASTSIAELLGHKQYSRHIQDCYRLLTKPLKITRGEVYQYVGDEVVISWEASHGLKDNRCLDFYYLFQDTLENHKGYFQENYGTVPTFKAAVHIGHAMVAEVGQVKSEIAFHGDVLNTTSRIHGFCQQLNEAILITESLRTRLPVSATYSFIPHGSITLKGKESEVEVFGVNRDNSVI